MEQKNKKLLDSFVAYCESKPELRFWQALRGWANVSYIGVCKDATKDGDYVDTFYADNDNKNGL